MKVQNNAKQSSILGCNFRWWRVALVTIYCMIKPKSDYTLYPPPPGSGKPLGNPRAFEVFNIHVMLPQCLS